jgi:glycosyltransferase involved in cell wall biosynthesis
MHVAQTGFLLHPRQRQPAELLSEWHTLVDTAEAAVAAGCRVAVLQAAHTTETITRNGVDYHFAPAIARPFGRSARSPLNKLLQQLRPDVLHVHGLGFPRHVGALRELMPAVPVLLQDHADRVPRLWRWPAWRHGHRTVAGAAFCAAAQAQPFMQARLLGPHPIVFEIPEATSRFTAGDPAAARSVTGVRGSPAILWVGHLNHNKDPLTVLRGFNLALRELPQATLWMCFGSAPLMPEIRRLLAANPPLAARVHLLGRVPHAHIQELMRAADLFVLGSHREGSGYSLIEALATGLTPVVTDIPSFRSLTGNGAVGALWPCDDSAAFAQRLLVVAKLPAQRLRTAATGHFAQHLSAEAVGSRLASAYERLVAGQGTAGTAGA